MMNEAVLIPRRGSLKEVVIAALSARIDSLVYAPGDKLPLEQELCREFGVSRTVVREAAASLRLGDCLYSRQGLGVFVTERDTKRLEFEVEPTEDVRSALQIRELRLAVEVEAVGLAAQRRTPTDVVSISKAFDRLSSLGEMTVEEEAQADFDFHLAVAKATGNPHFPRFLEAVKRHIATNLLIKHSKSNDSSRRSYLTKVNREHGAIMSAVTRGDVKTARVAIWQHLAESMVRYRRLLS